MKVSRTMAVSLLVALGFAKATQWEKEKLAERIGQIPDKVSEDEVPEGFADLYHQLEGNKEPVEITDDEGDSPDAASPAKSKPEPKPAKSKPERDAFGCKRGTISSKVNAVMTKDWKDEVDIIKEAGLGQTQVRDRLYFATEKGQFEYRRLIQYRIAPKTKA